MMFSGSLLSSRASLAGCQLLANRSPFVLATAAQNSLGRSICSPPTASTEAILVERKNGARTLVLNRPKVLNALDLPMIHTLYKRLSTWEHDDDVRMVMIKGAGGKAFCAGGDVVAVRQSGLDGTTLCHQFFYDEYLVNNLIATYQKPYVAILNGITMGGGVGVSVHGQFRVCTDNTMFAMPETAIGLFPDVGGGYFLPRLEGQLGMFLALTGHRLKGVDVLHAGIATHYCRKDLLPEMEDRLTSLPNQLMMAPVEVGKILKEFEHRSVEESTMTPFSLADRMEDINRIFDAATVEEIMLRLKNENSEWSLKTHEILSKMVRFAHFSRIRFQSPLSLKLTHRQIRSGAFLNLDVVLTMEYRMTQAIMAAKGDFYEGVRAVLIDKDNAPKWNPATLEEIDQKMLNNFFKPLGGQDLMIKPIAGQFPKI